MKKIIIYTCILLSTVACTAKMKTQRIELDKSDKLAMSITNEWLAKDTENTVKYIIEEVNKNQALQEYLISLGRKPKIFIANIQNQTSEAYFPIGDLNDELLIGLSNSGKFVLIDDKAREEILSEILYQNITGLVDEKQIKQIGRQSGADLLIFGDIRMKPESLNGKTIKDYSVNIRMTNIENAEELLRLRYKTSKYSSQTKFGW